MCAQDVENELVKLFDKHFADKDASEMASESDEMSEKQLRAMKELQVSKDQLLEQAAAEGFAIGSQSALYRRYMRWPDREKERGEGMSLHEDSRSLHERGREGKGKGNIYIYV